MLFMNGCMELNKEEVLDLISKYNISYAEGECYLFNIVGKNIVNKGYLKKEELLDIVRWKSARAIRKAEANSDEAIEKITKFAFEIDSEEVKISVLTSLNGVSIPMASSILTIPLPEKYGVIDIRGWQTLYNFGLVDYKKDVFNVKDWLLYLRTIRALSDKFSVTPREIDKSIFMYDKINRKGNLYKT